MHSIVPEQGSTRVWGWGEGSFIFKAGEQAKTFFFFFFFFFFFGGGREKGAGH